MRSIILIILPACFVQALAVDRITNQSAATEPLTVQRKDVVRDETSLIQSHALATVHVDIDKLADKFVNKLVTRMSKVQVNHSGLDDTMLRKPGEMLIRREKNVPRSSQEYGVNGRNPDTIDVDGDVPFGAIYGKPYGSMGSAAMWPPELAKSGEAVKGAAWPWIEELLTPGFQKASPRSPLPDNVYGVW